MKPAPDAGSLRRGGGWVTFDEVTSVGSPDLHSEADGYRPRRLDVHGVSWLAGGVIMVVLLALGSPGVLSTYSQPGFIELEDLLRLAEPFAMIASTVFAVEHLIRRCCRSWQLSLKEVLIAFTIACLVISVTTHQYRLAQHLQEITEEAAKRGVYVDFVYPPLVVAPWFLRLPLWLGSTCLAYAVVQGVLWGVRTAIWWLTLNWERRDDRNGIPGMQEQVPIDHGQPSPQYESREMSRSISERRVRSEPSASITSPLK